MLCDLSHVGPPLWPPARASRRRCRVAARRPCGPPHPAAPSRALRPTDAPSAEPARLRATDSAREALRSKFGRPARVRDDANARGPPRPTPPPRSKNAEAVALFSKTLMQAQKTRDGRTCSWCKLVGKRNLANVTLAPCGPCLRRRGVSVLYCSRKCQREAWQTHKPICAATPWSLAQHRFHGKGQREYVRRLVQDHLIHTLAWKREPSHASSLLTGRILPYLLSYAPPPPGWSRHWSPSVKRYALSLTLIWARTLAYERESANARGVWRDHVLPFLLDASTAVPEGW